MESTGKFQKFRLLFKLLFWKALLVRKHMCIITLLEILMSIIFSLQIRLIFEPLALNLQELDEFDRSQVLASIPEHVICRYAPRGGFVDELMSDASRLLRIDNPYMSSGFMSLQIAVEYSFVQKWKTGNRPIDGQDLTIGRFPFYKFNFLLMPSIFRADVNVIYYLTIMSFVALHMGTLQKVVHDKEKGFREIMRLMGMPLSLLYVGWMCHLLIVGIPVTIISAILLHPVFYNSNGVVIAIFILEYIVMATSFMFFIGTFFNHANKALLVGLVFWMLLAHVTVLLDHHTEKMVFFYRILTLALPHSGLLYGLTSFTARTHMPTLVNGSNIVRWVMPGSSPLMDRSVMSVLKMQELDLMNDLPEGAESRNMLDVLRSKTDISMSLILISWIIHIIFWSCLAIYFDNVRPGNFGAARSWYYPCKRCISEPGHMDLSYRGSTNWSAVEKTPLQLLPWIRIRELTKKFGSMRSRVAAVDDMSIDFYKGEFNVILGHNGAGKSSLLKLIVGMYKPSRGKVHIEGRDSNVVKGNLIGYCPQENILVNYLSVLQHLYFFGMLKGMSYKAANEEAEFMLKQLGLQSKKHFKGTKLPFETQRRVCLAMALMGNSKILVLDEPTHGVDPQNRRQIWDLLMAIKSDKTILMATHSAEAADILADRTAIISNGRVECYGTKMYLNRHYGAGYVLNVLVQEDCDLNFLSSEIQKHSHEHVNLASKVGMVVRYNLPRHTGFKRLLRHLEHNKDVLGITSLGLRAASIEGQFVRIGLASQLRYRHVNYPLEKLEAIAHRRRHDLLANAQKWTRSEGKALWRQQTLIMFHKKLLHILSSWKLYVFSLLFSMVALGLTMTISHYSPYHIVQTRAMHLNVTKYTRSGFHMLYYADNNSDSMAFLDDMGKVAIMHDKKNSFHVSKYTSAVDLIIHQNLYPMEFRDHYFLAIDILETKHINLMYSPTAIHSGPIAVNFLHNALLRYHSNCSDCLIKLKTQPILDPEKWQHRMLQPRSVRNWQNVAILVTLFLVLPSIDLMAEELRSSAKQMQLNTIGVTTLKYWVPIYIMDVLVYTLCLLVIACITFIVYSRRIDVTVVEMGQVATILMSYGVAAIPMGYNLQIFSLRPGSMYIVIIILNFAILTITNGSVTFPLLVQIVSEPGKYFGEILMHLFPQYTLACAVGSYFSLDMHNRECKIDNTCGTKLAREDPCCQNCGHENCFKPLNIMQSHQSGANFYHSVMDDIFIMLTEALLFFLILQLTEKKNREKLMICNVGDKTEVPNSPTDVLDTLEEQDRVNQLFEEYKRSRNLPTGVSLAVQNLTKLFGKRFAVRGVSFSVNQQECFGLLGVNGSGKTTIFRILTGQERPTGGKAVAYHYDLEKHKDMILGMTGYCPQYGGLNEFMSARQSLRLHAALRGISPKHITAEIDKWLDILGVKRFKTTDLDLHEECPKLSYCKLDLLEFENLKLEKCAWGIRRKVCVLQSLIGDLPIVLLDEPSAGIDPIAGQALCDTLHQVREMGRSLIVTTQSMEESEALCLRVGILVDGQFVAIGSCEQLKNRHGNIFTVDIRMPPEIGSEKFEATKATIEEVFPGIAFKGRHLGLLHYEIGGHMLYSNIFDKLDKIRAKHTFISDYSVNQPTMEQVFLSLAKKHQIDIPAEKSAWNRYLRRWNLFRR